MADKVDAIIKVKRGPEEQRKIVTFGDGELAYSNDTKRLFIGDGILSGGNPVSTRIHTTSQTLLSTLSSALSGDLVLDVNNNIKRLYALTGADYSNLSAYTLLTNSDVDTIVQTHSANWDAGGIAGNAAPGTEAWTVVSVNSATWIDTYTVVSLTSATWNAGGGGGSFPDQYDINTTFKEHSAAWEYTASLLSGASVQTFTAPLTASGKFLVTTINGIQQAIMLWNTP